MLLSYRLVSSRLFLFFFFLIALLAGSVATYILILTFSSAQFGDMSHQPGNNRFQPLSLYTNSPMRMDYNRALPPLADQPLLELRRPANKDACFAISALSPTMSKRFGGDWDSMSGRTSLLDRYLGQQAISPIIQELPRNPVPSPAPDSRSNVPANSKALWALMAQSVRTSVLEYPISTDTR